MKKFLCFSTLVMGGITLGLSVNNAIWERWSDSDTLTVFSGLCVVFAGVMVGLNLPSTREAAAEKEAADWKALAERWETNHTDAARQRDEVLELMHRIEKQRDDTLANYERALNDWQKTTDALQTTKR